MAFIRLADTYIDHPKFLALSADAFRLWHEGMAFCKKHQTDGFISAFALRGFRYHAQPALDELLRPCALNRNPLWRGVDGGYQVHDFLEWNDSKDEEQKKRRQKKRRQKRWRTHSGVDGARDASQDALVSDQIRSDPDLQKQEKESAPKMLSQNTAADLGRRTSDARSNRPIFKGNRLVVFEWQLSNLMQILGPYVDTFAFDEWFDALDSEAVSARILIPKRDGGAWLESKLLAEAKRRGLPIAGQTPEVDSRLPVAWQCTTCGEVHEGTREQAKRRVCTRLAS